MKGEGPAFLDTNVLVYAFDRGEKRRRTVARTLIDRLAERGLIRLSTQVLQEFLVTVTRKIEKPVDVEVAIRVIDDLEVWGPYVIGTGDIKDAARLAKESRISFWDALVVVAAAHSGAAVLYTEDLGHGQSILGVQVINPFAEPASAIHDKPFD